MLPGLVTVFISTASAQKWGLRPELMVTSVKGNQVGNSAPFSPFKSNYYNYPDIMLFVEKYSAANRKISIGFGTFSTGFEFGSYGQKRNGILGFLFPYGYSGFGLDMGFQTQIGYSLNVLNKARHSKLWVGAGVSAWFYSSSVPDSGITNLEIKRGTITLNTNTQFGMYGSLNYQIGNKKGKEVFQLFARYGIGLKRAVHEFDIVYDAINPSNGQLWKDQQITIRQNCTNIQVGISKTLKYFPAQRKSKPLQQ
ncbi:hypothetical protein [Phnomibacter sp. MR]|uniref:hypothetical protein n=1 Tax=Phnomibacter sp. MR TaxID=3042318 RepID=UPI003A7FB92E